MPANTFSLLLLLALLWGCQQDRPPREWTELSLEEHGLPLQLLAPPDARIQTKDMAGFVHDITIRSRDTSFALQVFASPVSNLGPVEVLEQQRRRVRENPYFEQIVSEYDHGFIYRLNIDGQTGYGFRLVRRVGEQDVVLQNGLSKLFSEREIRRMYRALQ